MPVIRNVEEMNYADIEKAINALGEKVHRQIYGVIPKSALFCFCFVNVACNCEP